MKITITPSGGNPFLLGDDTVSVLPVATIWPNGAGGAIREGFVNKQRRNIQTTPLFRGAYPFMAARFNWTGAFSFTVQRSFANIENCLMFIASHPDTVPASGEITLSNVSGTGSVSRYLPGAFVERVECTNHIGLSCDFTYGLTANTPWQNTP